MSTPDPDHIYRVRWRRLTWEDKWRTKVRYFATEAGAQKFAAKLLNPRPGDSLPITVKLQRAKRSEWETIREGQFEPQELMSWP